MQQSVILAATPYGTPLHLKMLPRY
ncbi:hypothetical protein B4U79_11064 [Dinothrombium tinctorium]|uniref:Uncharacterized protein n=1 Tax=Dinothrombium tinctorium TaxID=1965070 RepID=A0A3S3RKT9_9ACAR|nr:hypothetical protein B4U79_11064 [Dinothrombium tinctorium]